MAITVNIARAAAAVLATLTEGPGLKRVRSIIGSSMGGMQVRIWSQKHPEYMDVAIPMASFPTDVEPQLDAAASHHRFDPQRPVVDGRRLHGAAE